ncbi:MAG: CocE/NonD family hydrolase [SAR202 cluster bacterium]|nr:CocE/NonD family hydrolase [SAR202 cluster bacterium]
MPRQVSVKFESDVPLMLRDGTITYADIYRPDNGHKYPALLMRTPYNKSTPVSRSSYIDAVRATMNGYAVVIQDVRGRFSSDGEFYPFANEIDDGYDSIEWVAGQPWCSGKVGMFGNSYMGATQWLAAKARPESLCAIAPGITASDYHEGWVWHGGAFALGFNLSWTLGSLVTANWDQLSNRLYLSPKQLGILIDQRDDLTTSFDYLPMRELPDFQGGLAPYYYDWMDHPEYDDFWARISIEESHSEISVPALNIGGWFDTFLGGTIQNFRGMRENASEDDARLGQRLIIGPWIHNSMPTGISGEFNFGTRAAADAMDLQGIQLHFFDNWLKEEDRDSDPEKPVKIFVMGENEWRDEEEWPLARAQETKYFLHSNGRANTLDGDGLLSGDPPDEEPADVYVYNPNDPVPTLGGPLCGDLGFLPPGVYDQRVVESRSDVLVYTTLPLDRPVEVTGPVVVTLYSSSTARDTDFTAKLVDVSPDGYARNVAEGIVRARYRTPRASASLIDPGRVYEYKIDLWSTSNLFRVGHKIRLEISSSNYPRFDRNTNTGKTIGTDDGFFPALQSVHHTASYASYVKLPVVPRDDIWP